MISSSFGLNQLHLGQTEAQVQSILGRPDKKIKDLTGSYYYVYHEAGVDLDFGKSGGKVKVIFFYRNGCQGHNGAEVRTDRGVKPGDARSKMLRLYGSPDKQGGPLSLPRGGYSGEWFFYNEGIQFELGPDQKINVISVCRRTKNKK